MIDIAPQEQAAAISFLPATAVLEMTYRCNHSCLFCSCPWENPDGPFKREPELNTTQWKEAIQKLSAMGVANFCFTGGEALLRDDIWEIIGYAGELNDKKIICDNQQLALKAKPNALYLISNGKALTVETLKLCKQHNVQLSISLPGLESFRELTGGNAEQVLSMFGEAKRLGLSTVVNVTVTKKNLHELYETISAGFLAGADQLLLNMFLKGGRGLKYARELALSTQEMLAAMSTAEEVLEKSGRFGNLGTELPKCLLRGHKFKRLNPAHKCSAAKGFFVLGPSGYIRVCNHSQKNLCRYPDIETLKTDPYWKTFTQKTYLPEKCFSCDDAQDCDGGCREEAHILSGSAAALHELVKPPHNI